MPVTVRRLVPADVDRYAALRQEALTESPVAFATDADAWRTAPRATIEAHLDPGRADSPILGAWLGPDLVGLLGLNREARPSVTHKASLWGFYVTPARRRAGVGGRLLDDMNAAAVGVTGLRHLRAVVPVACADALSLIERRGFVRFGLEQEGRYVGGSFHDQVYLAYALQRTR